MTKNFTVRQLGGEEAPAIATMVGKLLKELSPDNADTVDDEYLEETAYMLLDDSMRVWAFLAFDEDGEPIGVLTLSESAAIYAGGVYGEITELHVKPSYRSSGVGAALLETAREFSRKRGWKRLEVSAPDSFLGDRTLDFFTRQGFAEGGPRLRLIL